MRKEDYNKIKSYEHYEEGSWQKKIYDENFIDFQMYLDKYADHFKLDNWFYFIGKFVKPLFDGTPYSIYRDFLYIAKPSFNPDLEKLKLAWGILKDDNRFDEELKQFFAFMCACDFLDNEWKISFEDFLRIENWMHPWYHEDLENMKPILEIIEYERSIVFLKAYLAVAPWLNRH